MIDVVIASSTDTDKSLLR